MQHRPLQRERLTRRQTVFTAHLLFELFSFTAFTENHVCSLPPEFHSTRFSTLPGWSASGPYKATCRMGCANMSRKHALLAESGEKVPARILNGVAIRDQIYSELKQEIAALSGEEIRPGLAAVLAGENPASQIYVRSKIAACEQLGLGSWMHTPPATVTTDELLALVAELNARDDVDGILVQLPLPSQADTKRVLEAVDPAKDVDGFHPVNLGRLVSGRAGLVACTPAGCMEILRRSGIPLEGADAVVVGRSDIVGKPMALLLMHANATVTICHSKTRDLPGVVRRADIVIAAIGRVAMIDPDWVRPGATVIDVGINRITDATEARRIFANFPAKLAQFREKGSVLVGDVHPGVAEVAGAITPVPGGVGPLTIAMLMSNTVKAARLRRGSKQGAPGGLTGVAAAKP
jgi:methylenetetrahydrofolate dehydrogenase (NADP+)/methenyltetrahydrofolate cyclohydrolase